VDTKKSEVRNRAVFLNKYLAIRKIYASSTIFVKSIQYFVMKNISGNKVHFTSLGCARNLVDTEVMMGILLKAGFEATADESQADFFIVNTCGFLQSARDEAFATIDELFSLKKKEAKVVVAGCMVQLYSEQLRERFPEIHYFLGSGDVEKILQAVTAPEEGEVVSDAKSYLQMGEVPRLVSTPKHYAYLKIAEGCKKRCSFCIIPVIKGALKSKPLDQIVKEFQILRKGGAKEIILIAQDLGDYGKDVKESRGLYLLLQRLLQEEGDFWIRLLYLYPDEITDEIIELIRSDSRLLPYLDMPMQHINDRILKAMHRKTSREHIELTLAALREKIPDIVIRTSLMVGFPGETEEEFQELVSFVEKAELDQVGIFTYSKEEDSYSAKLDGHIEQEIKDKRRDILAEVQQKVLEKHMQKYVGRTLRVLVEGYHPESDMLLKGRFYGQCPEIDGIVIINDWRHVKEAGQFYDVKITEVAGYDLVGRVLPSKVAKSSGLQLLSSANSC